LYVEIAVRRAHLLSLNPQAAEVPFNFPTMADFYNSEINKINALLNEVKLYTKSLEKISVANPSDLDLLSSAASEQRTRMLLDDMAPISLLETCEKRCSHSNFFDVLVKEIRTQASKCQRILARNKKIKIQWAAKVLRAAAENYVFQNANNSGHR
jgi:hypothetical protein